MYVIPHPADRPFSGSMSWTIPSPNQLQNITTREGWDKVSANGEIRHSSVAPRLTFEKTIVAVRKLVTDLGVGDPEEIESCTLQGRVIRQELYSLEPGYSLPGM